MKKGIKNEKVVSGHPVMPATMHNEFVERQQRERIVNLENAVRENVKRLRSLGVQIKTADDLKKMTPDYIRNGIASQRAKQLEGQFIPQAIRHQWEREFANMERELIPASQNLQDTLKTIKWPVIFDDDPEQILHFDADKVEDYIEQQATDTIPPQIRDVYCILHQLCSQWNELQAWCKDNGVMPLTMQFIRTLSDEGRFAGVPSDVSAQDVCMLSVSPETMYKWWLYGIVRMQQPASVPVEEEQEEDR